VERDGKAPHEPAARRARTRRTRTAVVEAARALFLERGYAATTIEAISERSDTPRATVYRLFSSKLGILKAVLDISVVGDDQAVAMLDRPKVRAVLSERDPTAQLEDFTALVREVMARVARVHRILAEAAGSDEGAACLLARSLVLATCGPGSGNATRPTSSTRSPLPRSTACSCSTAAGATSATRPG
jgi:AcrR family transcriptional regulator